MASPTRWLVFEGNKMVSEAYLNGAYLGFTADQFLCVARLARSQ